MKKFILGFLFLFITQTSFANENSLAIPMTIFGDITYSQNMSGSTLNIYNTDKYLLNSLKLSGNTYGSNDAFEIDKRVNLNKFENSLVFEIISGNTRFSNITSTSTGNYNCSETPTFQTNKLCKYDLNLTNASQTNVVNLGIINNLQISNFKDTSLTLSWDTISNIDGFIIINKNSNSQIKQTSNTYDFTNLLPNTDYIFQIYAYKGDITGEIKEIILKTPDSPKQISAGNIEADSINLSDLNTNEEIKIVSSNNLEEAKQIFVQISSLDTTNDTSLNITKSPVTLDNTTNMQKRLVFLPQDITQKIVFSIPAGVKPNNNAIIYPPVILERKEDLKSKIENSNLKVNIVGAMQVPTSESTTFNGDIELCMPANGRNNIGNLVIYYSTNGTTWQKDTHAKGLKIANDKICFKTNHLTSFAGLEETIIGGSTGGGGGGGGTPANCLDLQVVCEKYLDKYVWKVKTGLSCSSSKVGQVCKIKEGEENKDNQEISIIQTNLIEKIHNDKLKNILEKFDKIISKKINFQNIKIISQFNNEVMISYNTLNNSYENLFLNLDTYVSSKDKNSLNIAKQNYKIYIQELSKLKKLEKQYIIIQKNGLYKPTHEKLSSILSKVEKILFKYKKNNNENFIQNYNDFVLHFTLFYETKNIILKQKSKQILKTIIGF